MALLYTPFKVNYWDPSQNVHIGHVLFSGISIMHCLGRAFPIANQTANGNKCNKSITKCVRVQSYPA